MLYQIVSNVSDKVELFIEDEMTVAEIRAVVGEMILPDGTENKTLRLTFQGHILDDDRAAWSSILSAFSLENNGEHKLFVHVSNGSRLESPSLEALRAAFPSSTTVSEEERAARAQARMMEPMIDAIAQNPAFLDAVIASQPQLQRMVRNSPEMERMLRDPETLKSMMLSQIDPDQRRATTRNLQLQLAQLSAIPAGEQLLERYAGGILRDMEAGDPTAHGNDVSNVTDARPDATKEANDEALPNPWKSGDGQATGAGVEGRDGVHADVWSALMAAGGGGGAAAAMPFGLSWFAQQPSGGRPSTEPPIAAQSGVADTVRWASQIALLKDMGFDDEALCIEALRATNGDVDRAVSFIVDNLQARR